MRKARSHPGAAAAPVLRCPIFVSRRPSCWRSAASRKRKPGEMCFQRARRGASAQGEEQRRDLWRLTRNPIGVARTGFAGGPCQRRGSVSASAHGNCSATRGRRLISRTWRTSAHGESSTIRGWLSTWARWPSRKRHDAPRLRSALGPQRGLSTSVRAALGCGIPARPRWPRWPEPAAAAPP